MNLIQSAPQRRRARSSARSRALRRLSQRGIYDVAEVSRLIDEHRAIVASSEARENHMMFLWQLLNLELGFQEVVERRPALVRDRFEARSTSARRQQPTLCRRRDASPPSSDLGQEMYGWVRDLFALCAAV